MMVSLTGVNKDSFVWDYATGSGAFLISAMNAMIKDAQNLQSPKEIESKIAHIKAYQLLGIEKRSDIYLLGILNMILLDDGSANLLHKDSLKDFNGSYEQGDKKGQSFPADVFLLNPPYSASGKGFIFVERALRKMSKGRACVIIQENAGSGNGLPYTADILKHSTLLASIKMPSDLFAGKSKVQTAIYVFEVGKAHNVKQMVKFIDFSSDGYTRAARKKAKASTNLKDTDNAKARYEELINVVLYGSGYLHYYKDFYIEDTINLEGRDWTYSQHKKIDTTPTLQDFKKCVSEYLAWEVSNVLKNSTQAGTAKGGLEGNALSPRLAKLENDFKQNGGLWREFKLGELFEHIKPTKHAYAKGNLPTEPSAECDLPAITCTSANQGIACYMPRGGAKILKNVISVAANGDAPAFYQPHEFAILQDAYALRFRSEFMQDGAELSSLCYLYLTSLLQKILQKYNWNNKSGWAKVSKEFITLPVLNEQIAFDFMESYIKALEAERLQELEAYLKVTGLNDYTLSQKEKDALKAFENLSIPNERERERERVSGAACEAPLEAGLIYPNETNGLNSKAWEGFANAALSTLCAKELEASSAKEGIEWREFKIGALFDVVELKKINPLDSREFRVKEPDNLHTIPAVVAKVGNNGVMYYVAKNDYETIENKIVIVADGAVASGLVYYHEREFTILHNAYAITLKYSQYEKREICLFFVSAIQNAIFEIFNYENKPTWNKVKEYSISLPVLPTLKGGQGGLNCEVAPLIPPLTPQTPDDAFKVALRAIDEINFDFMESFIKAIEKQHIEKIYAFWESKLKAYDAVINGGVTFTLSEYEEFCKGLKAQDFQFKPYHSKSFLLETGFSPCHTEPLGEVSKAEFNKDISLTKLAQYDKNHNIEWKSFKCEELFSVKSNPQLNKDSFSFGENAPYPYFTRTCLNNGIAGYVEYLDEEHKIKGESIAVGMLGMQFFYMQKDFYAGQFTKTLYPKFSGLNTTIAQFFIAWLNKNQKIFQGVLVRDFEKTFNETEILLPVLDSNNIDFNFIESFIKAIQKECIKSVVLWQEKQKKAYEKVVKKL
ncbi:restriction endonuclease subunit S [Campylobacter helveticus]|uniref:restriction endonuclease subunit S n=1 Tax=Campylobacter helveticus TaxID=28898 RepID=UPI0021499FE1|nr:restriction endonuclease subunit S [Campylobacter helveticus]MCR2061284.1 restriction endonuclease subunit S [Campylobacter helveticus]